MNTSVKSVCACLVAVLGLAAAGCGDDGAVYCNEIGRDETGFTCQCFDDDNDPIDGPVKYSFDKNGPKGCNEVAEGYYSGSPATCGPEVCNGYDDDCDGYVDEGGVCDNGCTTEVCGDGVDNDCDGYVDEGCSSNPPNCTPEVCGDGVDNDCDGYVDEGCDSPPPATSGTAFCAPQLGALPGEPYDGNWFLSRATEMRNCALNASCLSQMLSNSHPQFHCGWSVPGSNSTPGSCSAYCALSYGTGTSYFSVQGGSAMTAGAVDGDDSEVLPPQTSFNATLTPGPGAVCWSACEHTSVQ